MRENLTPDLRADRPWAHAPGTDGADPHYLDEHLFGTACLAEDFLPPGVAPIWGAHMGMRHDAGKARQPWQRFIREAGKQACEVHVEEEGSSRRHGPPHSPEGALRVLRQAGGGDVRKGMKFSFLTGRILTLLIYYDNSMYKM